MRKLYGKIEKILEPAVNLISILFQFYSACLFLFYSVFFLLSSETYVMFMLTFYKFYISSGIQISETGYFDI